jgi:hypothetical protein
MTDRTQFEAMLEALINEDQETAKEIFHNIVVAKSREIYEELLAEDFEVVAEEAEDDETGVEITAEEGANPFADSEEEGDEEESDEEEGDEEEVGGDASDDFVSDVSDEEGEEEGEEGEEVIDVEDRVMDLEDALEELKAEFEQLMADEEGEPEHNDGEMDPEFGADMGMDSEPAMGGDEPDELAGLMEYVNKVALPQHGDNGANTKSAVAGKNDMGGTTANIAKSFSTEKGGTEGGLLKPNATLQDGGNINKPGASAGKTAFKKKETATKAGEADNKKSIVGSRK